MQCGACAEEQPLDAVHYAVCGGCVDRLRRELALEQMNRRQREEMDALTRRLGRPPLGADVVEDGKRRWEEAEGEELAQMRVDSFMRLGHWDWLEWDPVGMRFREKEVKDEATTDGHR